ncbi:helix-turn-helix transcriptional regulator [Fusobacterium necrophorum]|uniref:helix-turn-helix transcriptional regulator n=1 Tax=Fusobacterium necrophorum TaxID=859 RepID=UPI00370F486F
MDIEKISKNLRKKYKMTQKDLAKILGISHQTISLLERGKYYPSKKIIDSFIKNFPLEFTEKKAPEFKLEQFEKEILETYELLRESKNPYTAIASFRRVLIDLNQSISESSIIINTLQGNNNFRETIPRIKRPIKTTLKYLETITNQLKDIIDSDYLQIEEDDIDGFK